MIRHPAVAGQFYSDDPRQLRAEMARLVPVDVPKRKVIGIVAPHAGYLYSGGVAGALYGAIELPETVIVIGPNHHGFGAAVALYPDGEWLTPFGTVPVGGHLAQLLRKHLPLVEVDSTAHRFEHSLEVQVPFLQYLRNDLTIVPLCLGFGDYERCQQLGEGIARAIGDFGDEVLIIASSDMTHYEPAAVARQKDQLAVAEMLALNPLGLHQVCRRQGITMCGVIPATVMLVAARSLGATKAELIRYATSGDVTGDNSQVVAYAGLAVW